MVSTEIGMFYSGLNEISSSKHEFRQRNYFPLHETEKTRPRDLGQHGTSKEVRLLRPKKAWKSLHQWLSVQLRAVDLTPFLFYVKQAKEGASPIGMAATAPRSASLKTPTRKATTCVTNTGTSCAARAGSYPIAKPAASTGLGGTVPRPASQETTRREDTTRATRRTAPKSACCGGTASGAIRTASRTTTQFWATTTVLTTALNRAWRTGTA